MKIFELALLSSSITSCFCQSTTETIPTKSLNLIPSATPTSTTPGSWRNDKKRQSRHVHQFFRAYGWLERNASIEEPEMPAAIRKIQMVLRDPPTGVYDERLDQVMSKPRCGTIPEYNATDANADGGIHKRFVLFGAKWNHSPLTYRFLNFTADLPSERQRTIVRDAFAKWTQLVPTSVVPAATNAKGADIHIAFKSMGPDENMYANTNQRSVDDTLTSGLINITFNDDWNWADDRLFNYTAVHEIGHALGLSHSKVEDALMFAYYGTYYDGYITPMHADDKVAIHSVYGWREPRWVRIDANSGTRSIVQVSSNSANTLVSEGLYQLRSTGQILWYNPSGSWTSVDNNKDTVQITGGSGGNLFQRHGDGSSYRYTGSGTNWQYIGAASDNVMEIVAAADQIYQRRRDGWVARWSGSGTTWTTIEQPSPQLSKQIAVTDSKTLYNLLSNGYIVRSEWPYKNAGWQFVDDNPANLAIAVGGEDFYKLQADGLVVWLDWQGPMWKVVGFDTVGIYAVGIFLYAKREDGSVWRYTGTPELWEELDEGGGAGDKPSCDVCRKWGLKCEYHVPRPKNIEITETYVPDIQYPGVLFPAEPMLPLGFEQAGGALDFMQFPGMNFDFSGASNRSPMAQHLGYPTPISQLESLPTEAGQELDQNLISYVELPQDETLLELANIFFEQLYHMFPCIHKASFLAQIHDRHLHTQAPLILYAMCTLAARYHPDPAIKNRQKDWFEQAKFLYEFTSRKPHTGLRTIQAVLFLVSHALTVGDFSASWLYIGKAWRQAVVLGMNRMDSSHADAMGVNRLDAEVDHEKVYNLEKEEGRTAVEKEEYRRTLWLLFMMDRNHSWPTGWPHAIDERQFRIDIPVAESVFQNLMPDAGNSAGTNTPFTRNLNALIASSSSATKPLNLFHYLIVAHVLLGRVTEHIHSLHDSPHTPEYAEACNEFDTHIVKFRLSLPRSATSVLETPADARGHVIWLTVMLNTASILLHYRSAKLVPAAAATSQFARALAAAQNTAQLIKDASRISSDLLLSPHVGSSLYIAACVLVIQWRLAGDETLKSDIDIFALVFERFDEVFAFLGLKFKLALRHDVERSRESVVRLRERGLRGLLADCSKWTFVQEEAERLGLAVS
ncbi:hypothetical protein BDV95DRAFT_609009 [Massariosphaeria phaeospora]|uniref:Peptidase metallopeptidase domain-containing protein n=1 Tax=Massariosphaeria phaeospora TaxID=100035 RepID=A0A7C8MHB0_9PLEO|nr:hypothetical protein BDV95DRAFT_609009 [Massariosphaeria phaeospora]